MRMTMQIGKADIAPTAISESNPEGIRQDPAGRRRSRRRHGRYYSMNERDWELQATAKLGRRDACDLAESRSEGGGRLVPYRQRDVGYGQLQIRQKLLGALNALHGQPFMGRMARRHTESCAEMETTETYEGGQLLETDLLIEMVAHIGGHAFDLPIGQTAPRR